MLLTAWHAATTLAAPALRLMLRRRAARGKEVRARLPERRGIDATFRPPGPLLWLHAASVGESASVLPVLQALANRAPDLHVLMTTGTVTSMQMLAQRLPALGLDRVTHRFVPWDVPAWGARFLDHWRPDAAAFVESEIWPNLVLAARARGIKLALVNARLSPGAARGWARAPTTARRILGSFDQVRAQSWSDVSRFGRLGARNVSNPGDLKFAASVLPVDAATLDRLRQALHGRPVWVAASTHPGEEAVIADAHRLLASRHPGLLTIIAPRHPERGPDLSASLAAPRRGAGQPPPVEGLWIADTLGELGLLYRLGGPVFVGKSLDGPDHPGGGQNPLEPARLGCAVAMGPRTRNFVTAVRVLSRAGVLTQVTDATSLAAWVDGMLRNPAAREAAGRAGQRVASAHDHLPDATARALLALL